MIATLAIARLAFKTAIRSRLFACMLVLLIVISLLLPATLQGDGTAAGRIRIILSYTLGLSWFTLAIAGLWSACSSIALEIEEKQLVLVATRPVSRARIWLGKWLGLLALNAVLLGVAAAAAGIHATVIGWRLGDTPEASAIRREILTARMRATPPPPNVDAEADRLALEAGANGNDATDEQHEQKFRTIRRQLLAQHSYVAPGATRDWTVDIPPTPVSRTIFLRFSLRSADLYKGQRITGTWIFLDAASGRELHRFSPPGLPGGIHTFELPGSVAQECNSVRLRFENSPASVGAAFDGENPVELLLPCGSFARNLLMATFVLWCRLALLGALGLAAGTLFSFNVATFMTICVIAMAAISDFYASELASGPAHAHDHGHAHASSEPSGTGTHFLELGARLNQAIQAGLAPAIRFDVIAPLADGLLIPPRAAARPLALLLLVYPALLFGLSVFFFNRRELAAWHRD